MLKKIGKNEVVGNLKKASPWLLSVYERHFKALARRAPILKVLNS